MNASIRNSLLSTSLLGSRLTCSPVTRLATLPTSLRAALTVLAWTLITALAAQAAFYLPGNPVPLTLQTAAVLACGLFCSPRVALTSMLSYVGAGLAGLPLFAGFVGGPALATSASAGYLASFIIAAPLMSLCVRKADGRVRGSLFLFVSAMLCHALILAIGTAGLKGRLALPWETAIALGTLPFVLGSVIKSAIVAALPAR